MIRPCSNSKRRKKASKYANIFTKLTCSIIGVIQTGVTTYFLFFYRFKTVGGVCKNRNLFNKHIHALTDGVYLLFKNLLILMIPPK